MLCSNITQCPATIFDIDPETLVVFDLQGTTKSIQVQGETVILSAFEQGLFASLIVATLNRFKSVETLILEKAQELLSPEVYKKAFLKLDWADSRNSYRLRDTVQRV